MKSSRAHRPHGLTSGLPPSRTRSLPCDHTRAQLRMRFLSAACPHKVQSSAPVGCKRQRQRARRLLRHTLGRRERHARAWRQAVHLAHQQRQVPARCCAARQLRKRHLLTITLPSERRLHADGLRVRLQAVRPARQQAQAPARRCAPTAALQKPPTCFTYVLYLCNSLPLARR